MGACPLALGVEYTSYPPNVGCEVGLWFRSSGSKARRDFSRIVVSEGSRSSPKLATLFVHPLPELSAVVTCVTDFAHLRRSRRRELRRSGVGQCQHAGHPRAGGRQGAHGFGCGGAGSDNIVDKQDGLVADGRSHRDPAGDIAFPAGVV